MAPSAPLFPRESLPHPKELEAPLLKDINLEITGLDIFFQGLMKANGKVFSSISAASAYIETFIYEEEILPIQIEIINHYKTRILLKATVFASFTSKFLEDSL